ncbi:MAG: glycosyltransferase family 39 protein [Planctomycetota bacterium]
MSTSSSSSSLPLVYGVPPSPTRGDAASQAELSAHGRVNLWTFRPDWADTLVRHRWVLVPLWLVVHLVSFNGQWRIGLDSSAFRHLGRSLAAGEGYQIFGEPQTLIYPGVPVLLGGLEYLFGEAVWPAIVVGLLFNAGSAVLVWLIAKRVLPDWAAVLATAGVMLNWCFVQQGHELMTDGPFFFGVVAALYGWEKLARPIRPAGQESVTKSAQESVPLCRWPGAVWLAVGFTICAVTRPTFWVLVGAMLVVGGLSLARSTMRRQLTAKTAAQWGLPIALVLVVATIFLIADPRTRGIDLTGGGYEADVASNVSNLGTYAAKLPQRVLQITDDDLPRLFFGERVTGLNYLASALLLVGVLALGRRRPLWVAMVLLLLAATLLASSQARYYLMVLPILWVGWLWVSVWVAGKFDGIRWRSFMTGLLVGTVLVANIYHVVKFVVEQRATPFLATYKDGSYVPVIATAEVLRERTEPGDVIIGPYARILAYLSDRQVKGRREIGMGDRKPGLEQLIAVQNTDAQWMVFPARIYKRKDKELYHLLDDKLIVPDNDREDESFLVGEYDEQEWRVAPFGVQRWKLSPEAQEQFDAATGLPPLSSTDQDEDGRADGR